MRSLLIFMAIFLDLSLASARPAGTVTLEGLSINQEKSVRKIILEKLPTNYDYNDLQEIMNALYATDDFIGIEIFQDEAANGKSNLIFRFIPVRTIRTVRIVGNETFSSSEILPEFGIEENQPLSIDQLKSGVENVQKFYNLNGFLNAKVSADILPIDNGPRVIVSLNIRESAPCLITDFSFKTSNMALNNKLEVFFKKFIKQRFSQSTVTQLQNEGELFLFEQKFFSASLKAPEILYNPLKTTVSLSYTIDDPYAYSLIFEGNTTFNDYKILKELKLDPNNRLSTYPVDDLTERLIRLYKSRGYANIKINAKEEIFPRDFLRRVTFRITEGPKVRIKEIVFDGRISRPSETYEDLLYDVAPENIKSRIFNSEDLELGLKNFITHMQNEGFISAKIISTRIDFEKRRDAVTVRVNMDEGPRTYIKSLVFKGTKQISPEALESVTGLKAKEPLSLNTLEESFGKIVDYYKNQGYLEVRILNQGQSVINYSEDNTLATITFEIYEGPLITVGNILVEGNTFTKDYVVTRELQFTQGEVLTPENISYSEQRLQLLSLFNSVEIRTLEEDPNQGRRTVLVRVTEGNPGIFKMGVGANNELDLSLKSYVGAAYRNLWGTGRGVNGRVEVNNKVKYNFYENDFTFGYTEPFIFGTKNTARLNLSQSRKIFQIDARKDPELVFALDSRQGTVFLERDLTRYIKLLYELYGFAHTNQFEIRNREPSKLLDIATTGPTIKWDRRNHEFNPSKGFVSSASFEYSDPAIGSTATVNYYKAIASHTRYFPLGPLVWATEGRAGYLKNISAQPDGAVPKIKSFVLGGRSTIRGFDPSREAFPRNEDEGFAGGIRTESHFYLVKSEIRFPIYGNFGGVLFYDGGGVYYPEFNPQFPWRDSVGIGFRYITPVGPFSVEYGHKLNRDTRRGEGPGFLHISFGVF